MKPMPDASGLSGDISEFQTLEGRPKAPLMPPRNWGKAAAEDVNAVLAKTFTVHTAFADARGDGKHKRIYGFVTTADGEDLSERLIRLGLARTFGVYRETPNKMAAGDYRAFLQDVELQAAKRGVGAWAKTNWDRLPDERQVERQENAELSLATASSQLPPGTRINPNTAPRDQLMRLPGVGEVIANRIIESTTIQGCSRLAERRRYWAKNIRTHCSVLAHSMSLARPAGRRSGTREPGGDILLF